MQFNSYTFILGFLPVLIVGYFAFSKIHMTAGKLFMVMASLFFYVYGSKAIPFIFAVSIIVNLSLSFIISRIARYKKIFLICDVLANTGLLLYFKYYNFFIENINSVCGREYQLKELFLPLGISFFTFQQIMYVVNIYKAEIERVDILDYLLYITYFPKLLMGPIAEPKDIISQFNDAEKKT